MPLSDSESSSGLIARAEFVEARSGLTVSGSERSVSEASHRAERSPLFRFLSVLRLIIYMRHNFKKLAIWHQARAFVKRIYTTTSRFPDNEKFGLTSQLRRAAISIPSNISEGCGRGTDKQFAHFLDIAVGSSCEVETQLYLAFDLRFISELELNQLVETVTDIRRMIIGFRKKLL